jgi:hypothetical protein
LRAGYWSKELDKEINSNTTVITAQPDAVGDGVHIVPKEGTSLLSNLIKDDGVVWKQNIISYLDKTSIYPPDIVIITGGPFMHFSLTSWFKKRYKSSKVILDYRDPFAINPGFDNAWIKVRIKTYFEKRFNQEADALITVNDYCGKLVVGFDNKINAIIQNGYDETVNADLKPVQLSNPSFSYTGKFYFDPEPILEAMNEEKLNFNHAGPEALENEVSSDYINSLGFVDYSSAVQLIAENDVGIIQTYGEDFQSTTKIFDYIRCNRAILVVSNRFIERGSIHEELKGYPNVFWAENSKESIIEAIRRIRQSNFIHPDPKFHEKYSREFQMKKLIGLIGEIKK